MLSGLSEPELQMLAARTVRKLFNAGELLFSEGEPCNGLHIIAQGKVRIFKTSVNGREQVLAVNVPGESIAETAGLRRRPLSGFGGGDRRRRDRIYFTARL